MNMRILFNNERVATFFTNCMQCLSFSNYIYLITWSIHDLLPANSLSFESSHQLNSNNTSRNVAARYPTLLIAIYNYRS
ncbi:hypothetical protein Syun_002579 [Stephania yunnanensis]|uniref:Uncharacterized protein n=1 Tax=Stephania yunnanensis TaxID=152371 RepID=A0AAP0Q8X4_9MAGN